MILDVISFERNVQLIALIEMAVVIIPTKRINLVRPFFFLERLFCAKPELLLRVLVECFFYRLLNFRTFKIHS